MSVSAGACHSYCQSWVRVRLTGLIACSATLQLALTLCMYPSLLLTELPDSTEAPAAALSVADMEQQGWVVPCFTCSLNQSALHDQVVDLQQRVVRCQEEVQIVVRETQDAAAFYTQQLGTLTAAIEAMEAGGSNCTTALQTLSTVVRTDDFETAGQYNKGQLYILHCKEAHCHTYWFLLLIFWQRSRRLMCHPA
ncbi:TPA: hypothetical protein ACH3X2_002530 [Trebouxia sp. C0005]